MKHQLLNLAILLSTLQFAIYSQSQIGQDIYGDSPSDMTGASVSLNENGTVLAFGAPLHDIVRGQVKIYQLNAGDWTQIGQSIQGEAISNLFGLSISLDNSGSRIAVGASINADNGFDAGHARIYQYNGSNWLQLGQDIDGEAAGDRSGYSVSLSGDGSIIAVGAIKNAGGGAYSGHVRVYQFNGSNWIQIGQDIDGENDGDNSGMAVSLNDNGNIVAIGAPFNADNGLISGHVRVYQFNGSNWIQLGQDIDGEMAEDWSGEYLAINGSGSIVAVGARRNDGNGNDSGHVRVFEFNGSNWIQLGQDIDGEGPDVFSGPVAINNSGNIVSIGLNSSVGNVRTYKFNGSIWEMIGANISLGNSVALSSVGDILAIGSHNSLVRVFDLSALLSVDLFANNIELLTYPNPVEDILFIKGHQSLYDIKIYDILGKEVFNDIVDESVDLTSLNKGLFFVKISDSNGGNLLKKIIKL